MHGNISLSHIALYLYTFYNQVSIMVPVDLFYPSVSYTGTIHKLAAYPPDSAGDFSAQFAVLAWTSAGVTTLAVRFDSEPPGLRFRF